MSNAAFLLIAIAFAVVASMLMWLRTRKPTTFMSSIDSFQREMAALARDPDAPTAAPRRPTKLKPIVPSRPGGSLAEKFRSARQVAGEELAERRRPRAPKAGRTPLVPTQGRGDLAERLQVARQRGTGGGLDLDAGFGYGDPADDDAGYADAGYVDDPASYDDPADGGYGGGYDAGDGGYGSGGGTWDTRS